MGTLDILRGDSDRDRWLEAWERWPEREPFAHPAYVAALRPDGADALGLVYRSEHGTVLHCVHRRPIEGAEALADLTDAYGYGGPWITEATDREQLAKGFWEAFDAWALKSGCVTQFSRPTLFEGDRLAWPDGGLQQVDEHVVWALQESEAMWMHAKHKVRKNVKRARRAGLDVVVDPGAEHLADFLRVYYSTLDRRDADKRYYFDLPFFEALVEGVPRGTLFVHVARDGEIVSTELLLLSGSHMYSFLGGTLAEALADRPNDLLKWATAEWGFASGRTHFVLGGGSAPGDGIFNYKLAFCPDGARPYRLGRRVLSTPHERALVSRRGEREPDWSPRQGWFPRYRS